jgi:hypothetical protein
MDSTSSPAGAGSRRRWILIGGALAALLLVVVVVVIVVSARGDSPTDVTERYLKAARERDRAGVQAVVCSGDSKDVDTLMGIVDDSDELVEWRMINETVTGESAQVRASITFANNGRTQAGTAVFTVRQEDGDWKVCAVRRAGSAAFGA